MRAELDAAGGLPAALSTPETMAYEDLPGVRLRPFRIPGNGQGLRRVVLVDQRGRLKHALIQFDLVVFPGLFGEEAEQIGVDRASPDWAHAQAGHEGPIVGLGWCLSR